MLTLGTCVMSKAVMYIELCLQPWRYLCCYETRQAFRRICMISPSNDVPRLTSSQGASGIHLEDQLHGGKKCGHLGGKVLVPTSTHISRLIAARFQTDIMKSTMLLIARTDSESGKLISSTVDSADHEFILGTTVKEGQSLAQVLSDAEAKGASGPEIDTLERQWMDRHKLVTFNQGLYLLIRRIGISDCP